MIKIICSISLIILFCSCNDSEKKTVLEVQKENTKSQLDTTIYPYELRNLGIEPSVGELSSELRKYGELKHPYWPKWYLMEYDFDNDAKKDRIYLLKGLNRNDVGDKYFLLFFKKKRVGYENFIQIETFDKPAIVLLDNSILKLKFTNNIINYSFENNIWKKIETETSTPEESTVSEDIISCQVCNKQIIGHGYNPELLGVDGQSYFCSLNCAKVDDINSTEKWNKILRKYGKEEIKSQLGDDKVYDKNACTMCKGTGIEKNTAQHILGGEAGRVCPMCEGKGR
jgi:hypothetical protein